MNPQPYGTWPSPISSELLARGQVRLQAPQCHAGDAFWLETRPTEGGRTLLLRRRSGAPAQVLTPDSMSVRTRIHEYGGCAYRVQGDQVFFINDSDQRLYGQDLTSDTAPTALSPVDSTQHYRYADLCVDQQRQRLICVVEIHQPDRREPQHCIAALSLERSAKSTLTILVAGNDFYSNPQLSPDGTQLSWLTWHHPHMPWDSTQCWVASVDPTGQLGSARCVAGASGKESIFQPQWSPDGALYFVSDRSQWWNLYRYDAQRDQAEPVAPTAAEFGLPQWVFGMSTYGFIDAGTLLCCYTQAGRWQLASIDTTTGKLTQEVSEYCQLHSLSCDATTGQALFIGAHATQGEALMHWQSRQLIPIQPTVSLGLDESLFATAQNFSYANGDGETVHGFYYAPHHPTCRDSDSALPPLIVICHGGPTGSTHTALNLSIQYWTSRGFAVADINYSGSTGYGRDYRRRLYGQCGIKDVDDICCAAEHLVKQGKADPQRLIARGSSAGGYTALAALTFRRQFTAGTSLYGIGDLGLLAEDTHKFESRYLDQLVGAYPEQKRLYQERSPIHHIEKLNCPVLFLQGLDDKVVPPNQAQTMVDAMAARRIPVAHVTFANEGHGFRQASTIQRALEIEYAFYAEIFSLSPEQDLPVVPFVN